MNGERPERGGFGDNYLRGLRSSSIGNSAAYGYSVTITATFGVLGTTRGTPRVAEIPAFVVGAVLAVAVVNAVASGGFRHEVDEEPSSIRALGSSLSIFSVGGALGLVFVAERLSGDFSVWPVGSFLATLAYLFAFALEIAVADVIQRRIRGGRGGEM